MRDPIELCPRGFQADQPTAIVVTVLPALVPPVHGLSGKPKPAALSRLQSGDVLRQLRQKLRELASILLPGRLHRLHALLQVQRAKDVESASDGNGQPWFDYLRLAMPGESFASSVQELVDALLWIEYASHVKEVRDGTATAE